MTSGLWKSISFSTGLPGMAKTHIKGPPEHLDVTSGQAMSAACRRRVRCHSAVPLLVAPRRWEMLRLRIDGAREILISRLQQFLAGIDAWLLQSPLWLMCVGLSFLGELCHWLLRLYVCRYYPVTIKPPKRLVRPKLRKVVVPTWFQLLKRTGPWRQACQRCLCDTVVQKARMVGPQRICGIRGARGLGNCFRAAPLKSIGCQDNARVRKCVFLIQNRWNIQVPKTPEVAFQCAATSSPQIANAMDSQCAQPAGPRGHFGNRVVHAVTSFLDKWNSHSQCMAAKINKETDDAHSGKENHFGLPQWAWNLRGGMPMGSRVTRRKRQEKQDNNSLASAVGEFLSQWQKQHPPARKTQKTSSMASSQDWYKGSSDDYDYGYWNYEAPQTHSDENLVQTLLTFLNTCQQQKPKTKRWLNTCKTLSGNGSKPNVLPNARTSETTLGLSSREKPRSDHSRNLRSRAVRLSVLSTLVNGQWPSNWGIRMLTFNKLVTGNRVSTTWCVFEALMIYWKSKT